MHWDSVSKREIGIPMEFAEEEETSV